MSTRDDYPATVAEVVDDQMMFNRRALVAVRRLARRKPWRGDVARRWRLFVWLNRQLAAAYGYEAPLLILKGHGRGDSTGSYYSPRRHEIVLTGLSLVTLLHEIGHARGFGERQACRWSLNLFRRCFPRSWDRLRFEGHVARARSRRS